MSLRKTRSTDFLTGILCDMEGKYRCLFHNCMYWRKRKKVKNLNAHYIVPPEDVMDCWFWIMRLDAGLTTSSPTLKEGFP